MKELVEDNMSELCNMKAHAPYVPALCLAAIITGMAGLIISA
jgi:hypothetical protein|nr:MAG TPA_asm: hypothetical protein [Caudoviricetes sp.]